MKFISTCKSKNSSKKLIAILKAVPNILSNTFVLKY